MSIELISQLVPKNNGQFALLDDSYIRGGFHIVANLVERNALPSDRRKQGMKVFVQSTDTVYELHSDLVSWVTDRALTQTLQAAYNNGNQIEIIDGRPFVIHNGVNDILDVSANGLVEVKDTLRSKDYTSSINATVQTNVSNVIIDVTDRTKYRAIQYCYTIKSSANNGYETGQLYLIHDDISAIIYCNSGASTGIPLGVTFNALLSGYDLQLMVTTDNSGSFSRIIHLFKIALT